jgi:kinetochore protein Spc24, fungi type
MDASNFYFRRQLIRDMAPIIDPEEDYLTILAAEEQIASAEARRKRELDETHAHLKGK